MRRVTARTVLNRQALNAFAAGCADGMAEIGKQVIAITRPPDATPFGEGLVTTGDWGVWAGSKKVDGSATKPRSVRLQKDRITLAVGYGFPGRFQELGTIHQPARPFLTPSMLEVMPEAEAFIKPAVRKRLASVR